MASLQFPLDYARYDYSTPMMGFQPMKIAPDSSPGNLKVTGTGEWVWLPIPPEGLETSYAQKWGEQTVGALKTGISKLTSAMFSDEKFKALGDTAMGVFKTANVGVGRGMIDKLTGTGGISQAMLEQAFISYSGPEYRTFTFTFTLRPKNELESKAIDDILIFFKKFSAPVQRGGSLVRLYEVPHIFEISFLPDDGLFGIKASALNNIEVKYGGEKYNTFRDTNKPVQTDLTLSFKEMHILTAEDFGGEQNTGVLGPPPTIETGQPS